MPVEIKCRVIDSRGLPVEGLPVYLTGENISFSGLTSPSGEITFIAPKNTELYIYIYNPIKRDFNFKDIYVDEDCKLNITLDYDLKSGNGRDEKLGTCEVCGNTIFLGERVYIFKDKVLHYDCFQNMRKNNYLSDLRKVLAELEQPVEIDYSDIDNWIVEYLEDLGFTVCEDVMVNYHMHPIEVYEATLGIHRGKDFTLDILALYPGRYPDLNLVIAISLYNSYRKYTLDLATFTPYKIIIRGWGDIEDKGMYRPRELPNVLKEIVKTELQLRGICG